MRRLSDLWRCMASELAMWCHTCTTRDFKTVTSRIEHEGMSFLTITLPTFGKDFERSLDLGFVGSDVFDGFRRRRGLPVFMSGFLSQVFDPESGELLPEPSVDCIFAVRQLCYLFAKIELPCSNARVVRAMEDYVRIEEDLEGLEDTISPSRREAFEKMSRLLFADVFSRVDSLIYSGDIEPRHGPGSTANGIRGNAKYVQLTWTDRLESIFPYGDYCIPNWRYSYLLDEVKFLEPHQELPVKVVPVPKTLRGPRIIAEEPVWMQYMQQAVLKLLVRELEDPEEFCSKLLGFTDQIPNRNLAQYGSSSGLLATLDLKEASDRVPYRLVRWMLSDHPWLFAAVENTRSTRAEIPSLGLCLPNLRKFASMGSALCFPFEAMVFSTIILMGIARQRGLYPFIDEARGTCSPLSSRRFQVLEGNVRVYGDDIIVPIDCVSSVIAELEAFGFVVNRSKSFWNGKFRESCGGDFYDGQDVTPVRLRKEIPTSLRDGPSVAAIVDFRNHLYLRGLWQSAKWVDENVILRVLKGHFPIVLTTSPCLGRLSFLPWEASSTDEQLHAPRVKGWVLRPKIPHLSVRDEWALVKCLSSPVMQEDPRHLDRSGRPVAFDIKLRVVSPF